MYDSSGLLWLYDHMDWLGSAKLYSTPSRSATPSMAYAPFGEGYAGGQFLIDFTGVTADTVADAENQSGSLEDFMFRRYSPVQGRWISPDPAGLAAVDPTNPQTWNRYASVMNNPLSNIDPSGLACYPLERAISGSCAPFMDNGVNFGSNWDEFSVMNIPTITPNSTYIPPSYWMYTTTTYDSEGNQIGEPFYTFGVQTGGWQNLGSGLDVAAANNGSLWGYLASKPWVVSWILPVAGPVPGVVGVGPGGSVAWNPKTHNLCVGLGLGASAGHNAAIGPLLSSSGNVDSILSGWSVSGGGNLPFPPTVGLGWQVTANSSGVAQGTDSWRPGPLGVRDVVRVCKSLVMVRYGTRDYR